MCYICFQVETQSWKTELDIQLIAEWFLQTSAHLRDLKCIISAPDMFYFLLRNIFPVLDNAVDRRKLGLMNQAQSLKLKASLEPLNHQFFQFSVIVAFFFVIFYST